ncbi:MAG TPA: Mu transposase C-terminal domain-containing protein [Thermomicrobiales bacterium]|nr:Mu transposase C-terminal domain-containing protein [Thermomicrobiales bacterium]
MATPPALTELTEAERERAAARFAMLRPFLHEGVPLPAIARTGGPSLRTLRSWVARYRRHGLARLARQPRADRGTAHRLTPEGQQLVEGLALQRPRPTAANVHRQVARIAAERGRPVPSYRTVAACIQHLDPGLVTLAHAGAAAYRETFDLLYRREATSANEVWQADHTPLDLRVHGENGAPVRPWLTVILDDYSRAVAGYRLSAQAPSALQTALVLRDAIWRKADPRWHVCGIPATFYTDHGSDFASRHLEQVALDLKMQLVFSMAGRPRGRGRIERFFQTVNQLFLSGLPGYVPPGTRAPAPVLTLAELDQRFRDFLLADYHHRVHGETGLPPQARWEASGFLPYLPESLAQLDLLLLTVAKPRKVQQDGIHFQGLRYLDLTLAAYVGESVVIRYDPADLAEIRVYHGNHFLCRAVCQEPANQTIGLKEIVHARTQRRKRVRDDLKERTTLVEQVLANQRAAAPQSEAPTPGTPVRPRLKRYRNE